MADPGLEKEKEKDYGLQDPAVAAAGTTNLHGPLDRDIEEKDYMEIRAEGELSSHDNSETGDLEKESEKRKLNVYHTRSHATTTTAITRTDSHVDEPIRKKPWYKKVNPLRWGVIPPVPETRRPSREYSASFLSLAYFQWMSPLMSVSRSLPHNVQYINRFRLGISGSSSRMISGLSTLIEQPNS
jgi:ATP-binding cassette, subfamily C (CFTR/MRP), member 1